MTELPVRFKERMKELLGDEYEVFEAGYDKERVQGLRFNHLKAEAVLDSEERGGIWEPAKQVMQRTGFSLERIPWAKEGFYYGAQDRPGKHPYHEAGLYYIQEPSAMAVVELLDPVPGDRVLDLCGAPGGKSSHIASRLMGEGFLLSNEMHPARARILSQNIERMGVRNAVVSNEEPGHLLSYFPEFFNKIVVDAPCSGEGMFRKDEGAKNEWSEAHVKLCAARQKEILDNAAPMLMPGGRMVYSTCTFAPEENEGTIWRFLESHKDFQVEKVWGYAGFTKGNPGWAGFGREDGTDAPGGEASGKIEIGSETKVSPASAYRERLMELEHTFRIMPHKLEGEGHFMAVLKKAGRESGIEGGYGKNKAGVYLGDKQRKALLKDYEQFLKDTLTIPEVFLKRKEYVLFGQQLYLMPDAMPDIRGLKILRPGLHMGTLKKSRFEPSHGLALALKKEEVRRWYELCSDGGEVTRYLKGETLGRDKDKAVGTGKGWVLVCIDGFSLGWGKLAGGILKNHYPKGLRRT